MITDSTQDNFPKWLPLVAVAGAFAMYLIVHPDMLLWDQIGASIGTAFGWSIAAYIGYWIAGTRESWAPYGARVAWIVVGASALSNLWLKWA